MDPPTNVNPPLPTPHPSADRAILSPHTNWVDFSLSLVSLLAADPGAPSTIIVCMRASVFRARARAHRLRGADAYFTLAQLAVARRARIVFAPTVAQLRARVAALAAPLNVLAVWDFCSVHKQTVGFAAQGVARTAAALVSARAARVVLGDGDAAWLAHRLPLLNTNVPARELQRALAAKTMAVRRVLARWFVPAGGAAPDAIAAAEGAAHASVASEYPASIADTELAELGV